MNRTLRITVLAFIFLLTIVTFFISEIQVKYSISKLQVLILLVYVYLSLESNGKE